MDDLGVPPFMETPMYVDVIGWKRAQAKKREKSSRSCSILGHKQYPASWFQVRVVFLFEMCFTHQFPFVHMEMSILGGFPSQPCLIPYPPEASNLRLIAAHGRKHTTVRPRKTSSGAF